MGWKTSWMTCVGGLCCFRLHFQFHFILFSFLSELRSSTYGTGSLFSARVLGLSAAAASRRATAAQAGAQSAVTQHQGSQE